MGTSTRRLATRDLVHRAAAEAGERSLCIGPRIRLDPLRPFDLPGRYDRQAGRHLALATEHCHLPAWLDIGELHLPQVLDALVPELLEHFVDPERDAGEELLVEDTVDDHLLGASVDGALSETAARD